MNRRRLVLTAAGAAVLVAAALMLRSGVQPPPSPVTGPDGQRISAYHDAGLVTPPRRPPDRPRQPGQLRADARRDGALVSWPGAPYGFEVRWSGEHGESGVRYVATPGTTLSGLAPGQYDVRVRAVDEVGRRSEPSGARIRVTGEEPEWQRGLGFLEDFTAGAALAPDRWRMPDLVRRCLHREADPGPLLLDGRCGGVLRPISPLVLADPGRERGSGGLRGRVVVLADTPPPATEPADLSGADGPFEPANELIISAAPTPAIAGAFGNDGVWLRVTSAGALLGFGLALPGELNNGQRLDTGSLGGPGALHRWELVFTADQVQVLLDGEPVGSTGYRPSWQRAEVAVSAFIAGEGALRAKARVGLVGLTGPAPDGHAAELVELAGGAVEPAAQQQFLIPAVPAARAAMLTGLAVATGPDPGSGPGTSPSVGPGAGPGAGPGVGPGAGRPVLDLAADSGGAPLPLQVRSTGFPGDPSVWFVAEVPEAALSAGGTVILRSAGGVRFAVYTAELAIEHRPGTRLDAAAPRVAPPEPPALAPPRILLTRDGQPVAPSVPAPRGRIDVEVRIDAALAQAATGGVAGWVAVRAELEGRRILDFPTAAGGPAFAGEYRFTLDTSGLAPGYHTLAVTLIPDRAGVAPITDRAVIRLG